MQRSDSCFLSKEITALSRPSLPSHPEIGSKKEEGGEDDERDVDAVVDPQLVRVETWSVGVGYLPHVPVGGGGRDEGQELKSGFAYAGGGGEGFDRYLSDASGVDVFAIVVVVPATVRIRNLFLT